MGGWRGLEAFTFVEALVMVSLMSLVVVAGISSVRSLNQSTKRQSQYTTAVQLAQGKLDEFLALEYNPPLAPFGSSIYTESNYVLLTEATGGTAPVTVNEADSTADATTELDAAKAAAAAAQKAYTDALGFYQSEIDQYTSAFADYEKAKADADANADDARKARTAADRLLKLEAAEAELAAAPANVQATKEALDRAQEYVAYLEGGGTLGDWKVSRVGNGATMASVISTVEPAAAGHVVTVMVQFCNYNGDSTIRLQTLVNKHVGGRP